MDSSGARELFSRAFDWLAFEVVPFGVNLERERWFFFSPRLAMGRFHATAGPSRWRRTRTYRLDYSGSRLPGPLRRALYDELKPLSAELCFGLGGAPAPAGKGDHFFFALTRR